MAISIRLNEEEDRLIRSYADLKGVSVSEVIRNVVLEKIEDEYDLEIYEKAMKEYRKNPKTYTHEEVAKILDLK